MRQISRAVVQPETSRITAAEAKAMARAVVNLFEKWAISDAVAREILGGLSARTYARWKAGDSGRIGRDLETRLALLMGIHTRLRYLFRDPARGYGWIGTPNSAFGERSPADVMGQGDLFSLARVRSYLDAERDGG